MLRSSYRIFACSRILNNTQVAPQTRSIKRWVAPTLRELRKRAEKLGPQAPSRRSEFIEWNFRAELFAFGKRLNEEFQLPLLQTAFTHRSYVLQEEKRQRDLGIEDVDIQKEDNRSLADQGEHLAREYVKAYLKHSLPKVPALGQESFAKHLLSVTTLAHVASHLGMTELILSDEYPPSDETLARTLHAVIGALAQSSGVERAFLFVRDFICTQLNQKDLSELWHIENPEEMLQNICKERKLSTPEPRLIGDCGKNTILAAYHVGLYSDKQLIGKGFGEDVNTAIKTASLDALHTMFGIQNSMRPFNFQLQVESKQINQNT